MFRFIYLLMHACMGGELWSHLREKGRLDDDATRFYSASVIEGMSYLHGMVSDHPNQIHNSKLPACVAKKISNWSSFSRRFPPCAM